MAVSKPPSACDGKPINTPMDAKLPWQAGVTRGPDQVEQLEQARRLRNRYAKLRERVRRKDRRREEWTWKQTGDARHWAYKQRRARAQAMWNSIHGNGRSVAWCAKVHGIPADEVFEDLKWWEARSMKRYGRPPLTTREKRAKRRTRGSRRHE